MPDNTVLDNTVLNNTVPDNTVNADLLDRVRKLLAKAEDEGCPPAEAEALTAKAAELMARYGIDRALLGALHPESDKPADRVFSLDNPWGDVKRHLLAGLAMALRCQCVQTRTADGTRLHVFGYSSDLERADILFTSLLVAAILLAASANARIQEAFQLMLAASVAHYALAYMAMFAIPILAAASLRRQFPRWLMLSSTVGFAATLFSLAVSIFPVVAVASPTAYAAKIILATAISNLAAGVFYVARNRTRMP